MAESDDAMAIFGGIVVGIIVSVCGCLWLIS